VQTLAFSVVYAYFCFMEMLLKQYENHPKETLLLVVCDLIVKNENLLSKASEFEIEKSELESKASELESQVTYLKFQLEQLKRMIFGTKSERFIAANNPEQLQLLFEVDAQEVAQAAEVTLEQIVYNRQKKDQKITPRTIGIAYAFTRKGNRFGTPRRCFSNEIHRQRNNRRVRLRAW
jgi:hypothetical protein